MNFATAELLQKHVHNFMPIGAFLPIKPIGAFLTTIHRPGKVNTSKVRYRLNQLALSWVYSPALPLPARKRLARG
jgi:hypothetical protein